MRNNFSINRKTEQDNDDNDNSSFAIDLSLLTVRQRKLIELVRRDFLPQVIKDQELLEDGNNKADLREDGTERLIHNTEIVLKHYQRLQKIEINLIKLCERYTNEIDPYNREIISDHIMIVQNYLSAYYLAITIDIYDNRLENYYY